MTNWEQSGQTYEPMGDLAEINQQLALTAYHIWTTSNVDHPNYSQTTWVPPVSHLNLVHGPELEFSSQTAHKFLTLTGIGDYCILCH